MNILKLGIWSGIIFFILNFIGWFLVAGLFPLHLPSDGADAIAAIYKEDSVRIRVGCVVIWLALAIYLFFIGTLSAFIRKVQHEASDALANTQLLAGVINNLGVAIPTFIWVAAAFRPDRDPEILLMMNDLAWLCIIAPFWPTLGQVIPTGIAALLDKAESPVFPRWYGYLALWVAVLSLPGALVPFFYSGPFAWNGILGFWLPATVYGTFVILTIKVLLSYVNRQKATELA